MIKFKSFFSLVMIAVLSIALVSIYGCSAAVSSQTVASQPISETPVVQTTTETLITQPTTQIIQPTSETPVAQLTTLALDAQQTNPAVVQPTTTAVVVQPITKVPDIQPTATPITTTVTQVLPTAVNEVLLAEIRSKAEQPSPGIYYIDAATAKALADNTPAIILDARYKADWNKSHIVGSLSLPVSSVWIQTTHPEQYIDPVTVVPDKDAVIITYCAPGCPAGLELAGELAVRGYHNLFVLIGGYFYWQEADYGMVKQ